MFNKNSIFFTINLTFIISILIVTLSMAILFGAIEKREHFITHQKSIEISKMVLREYHLGGHTISNDFQTHLQQLNYILLESNQEKKAILTHKELELKRKTKLRRVTVGLYNIKSNNYIILHTPKEILIIEDRNVAHFSAKWILIIYFAIVLLLAVLYFTIVKKLKPLKILQKNIKQLSKEDFNLPSPNDKKDEISLLANEFYYTAMNLKKIKESRNIFIRNIMHELKTPITKGKLLSELEQTPENNEKMKNVFLRLESLIVEFASIEELISTQKELLKKEYYLIDIVEESMDLLMVDESFIQIDFDLSSKLNIDFKLFTIAMKNLMDNGMKYSSDHQVTVRFEDSNVVLENNGVPLKYPLEKYFEPFFKGDSIKSNESFGLGLYIVYHILNAHNMELQYEYVDGKNRFIVSLLQ